MPLGGRASYFTEKKCIVLQDKEKRVVMSFKTKKKKRKERERKERKRRDPRREETSEERFQDPSFVACCSNLHQVKVKEEQNTRVGPTD